MWKKFGTMRDQCILVLFTTLYVPLGKTKHTTRCSVKRSIICIRQRPVQVHFVLSKSEKDEKVNWKTELAACYKSTFLQYRNFVVSSFVALKNKRYSWKKDCLMEIVERFTLHLVVYFVFPNWIYKILWRPIEFPPDVFLPFFYYNFFIFQSTIYRKKARNALHLLVYLFWTTNLV